MNRWSPSLPGRVLRRVGATVTAASLGALATALVLAVSTGPGSRQPQAGPPDRPERPSRAVPRDPGAAQALTDRLLPAAALPTTSGPQWSQTRTEPHEPRALAGSCHRYPLVSVGALRVAHRAYVAGATSTSPATAEHVVARFADQRTAWRAHEVLLAWHAGCGRTLADRPGLRISAPHELGDALRYAVTWTASDAGGQDGRVREDVALVRFRDRVTLVRVTTAPADPAVGRPTVTRMVERAARLLEPPGAARTR